jgi:hypothetical protein
MGFIQRPMKIPRAAPAQTWSNAGRDERGTVFLNDGRGDTR